MSEKIIICNKQTNKHSKQYSNYNIVIKAGQDERFGYLELHHIVPRCIFGENILNEDKLKDVNQNSNLVYLTAREHFVAHWLLHRAFPSNKKLGLAFQRFFICCLICGSATVYRKQLRQPSGRSFRPHRLLPVLPTSSSPCCNIWAMEVKYHGTVDCVFFLQLASWPVLFMRSGSMPVLT